MKIEELMELVNIGEGYIIYFNIPQSVLTANGVSATDIRLFVLEGTSWVELSTTLIDSSSDPVQFSAITTHFSNFVAAEKVASSPVGGSSGGGGRRTDNVLVPSDEPLKIQPSFTYTTDLDSVPAEEMDLKQDTETIETSPAQPAGNQITGAVIGTDAGTFTKKGMIVASIICIIGSSLLIGLYYKKKRLLK